MVGAEVRSSKSENWGGVAEEETGSVGDSSEKLAVKGEAWGEAERDEEGRGQGSFGLGWYLCTTTGGRKEPSGERNWCSRRRMRVKPKVHSECS